MTIEDLLTQPEGKTLEFKRDLSSLKGVLKTLVAFANTAGGVLVVGRTDSGTLVGVEDVLMEEERLANAVAHGIAPIMMPDIDVVTVNGKALLAVRVPHWPGPFSVKSEGETKGVYVRLGSTSRRAGAEMLAELHRVSSGACFDEQAVPEAPEDDLDMAAAATAFAATGRTIDEPKLTSLGVLVTQGGRTTPSHGGLLLFGQPSARQHRFPDAFVSCARFRGADKAEFVDRLDIEGGVLAAVDEVPKFVRRNTRLGAVIDGMRRQDLAEYPDVAVREVLVNAIAHSDYSLIGMRIQVAIYANRMEIQSPGMLPFGMTLDDLRAGVSKIRNRVVARVLRELGLMEQ